MLIAQLADLAVLFTCAAHKPGEPTFDFYLRACSVPKLYRKTAPSPSNGNGAIAIKWSLD
jgi:hypothetical protein